MKAVTVVARKLVIVLSIMVTACSHKAFNPRQEIVALYGGYDVEVCRGVDESITRIGLAYCLGEIYLRETNQGTPRIDSLGFVDLKDGDPRIPFVWVSISQGLITPLSLSHFGSQQVVGQKEWELSIGKLRERLVSQEKNTAFFRLK